MNSRRAFVLGVAAGIAGLAALGLALDFIEAERYRE